MLLRLVVIALLLGIVHCDLRDRHREWVELSEYTDFCCREERSELTIEDLFLEYPSLKPTVRTNIIELKRSFAMFLAYDAEKQQIKLIEGSVQMLPAIEHRVLARFIKLLKGIVKEEYEELSKEEKDSIRNTVDGYVLHKLIFPTGLKDLKRKKAQFEASHMTWKEFAEKTFSDCHKITRRWDMDPSYAEAEEAMETPEIAEAVRKFEESGGKDEMFSIHIDHQTREKNFKTVKINQEL